jgi:hypothetical protein
MADYLPKYFPGREVTLIAGAGGVTGGLLVNVAAVTATAGDTVAGVAGYDALQGTPFKVYRVGVQRLLTSASVTIGQPLKAAAGGTVVPWVSGTDAANLIIADAWSTAASGARVDAAFRIA